MLEEARMNKDNQSHKRSQSNELKFSRSSELDSLSRKILFPEKLALAKATLEKVRWV